MPGVTNASLNVLGGVGRVVFVPVVGWVLSDGNNQFSIVGDKGSRFDFWPLVGGSSYARDAGNLLGATVNYNLINPASGLVPIIFGGSYGVNFIGTTTIP